MSDQGVSLRRTATDRVSYEGRNKERSTMRERRKCRTRRERPIDGSRKTKKKKKKQSGIEGERSKREENKRVEIPICPQKLLEKSAAQKRKEDTIYAREHHFTLLPSLGSISQC